LAPSRTNFKARTGVLAGVATMAFLALPGIANAALTTNAVVNGKLTVTSSADDAITVTCSAPGGNVQVNGANPTTGATACAAVNAIEINGGPGQNTINLDGVAGDFNTLASVLVNGGDEVDTIIGSQKADRLVGQRGNDIVSGRGGNDTLVWNGGEGDDKNDGEAGTDTIEVNGAAVAETFTVKPDAAQAGRIRFDRVAPTPGPPAPFFLDIASSEVLDLNMNAGNDTLTAVTGLDALGLKFDVDGAAGDDVIQGSDAADLLKGGADNDTITPEDNPVGTVDDARGDAGNDRIIWTGGDDNDLNDGGEGNDVSQVNGAPANETFTVKPGAPGHVVFDRTSTNPQAFTVDMTETESLRLTMNDGNDTITWNGGDDDDVNDGGDGNDTSVINGATLPERFTIKKGATAGRVQFNRTNANPGPFSVDIGTTELLRLNANDGDDVIKGFSGLSGLIDTELNGEGDDDRIRGTDSEDRINAGKGHDIVNSIDRAEDLLDCGSGLDLAFVDRRDFLRNCNIVIGGLQRVKAPKNAVVSDNGVAAVRLKCVGTKKCKGVARLRSGGKTLGSARFNIKSGKKTVNLKLNGKGKRLMAKASAKSRVKLQIDAKDSNGNGWRSTSRLTLK
jgi:Ca2+-binding RTX toxin-like protein